MTLEPGVVVLCFLIFVNPSAFIIQIVFWWLLYKLAEKSLSL